MAGVQAQSGTLSLGRGGRGVRLPACRGEQRAGSLRAGMPMDRAIRREEERQRESDVRGKGERERRRESRRNRGERGIDEGEGERERVNISSH